MALIRQNDTQGIPGALILCSDRGLIDKPAILFYSNRKVEQAYVSFAPTAVFYGRSISPYVIDPRTNDPKYYDPIPMSQLLGPTPVLAIIDARLVDRLPSTVHFSRISANPDYELGTVARVR